MKNGEPLGVSKREGAGNQLSCRAVNEEGALIGCLTVVALAVGGPFLQEGVGVGGKTLRHQDYNGQF